MRWTPSKPSPSRIAAASSTCCRGGERPAGDVVEALAISQPGVSKHLRLLREAGLVRVRADGQRRLYSLSPREFAAIEAWLEPYRVVLARPPRRLGSPPGEGAVAMDTGSGRRRQARRATPTRSSSCGGWTSRSRRCGRRSPCPSGWRIGSRGVVTPEVRRRVCHRRRTLRAALPLGGYRTRCQVVAVEPPRLFAWTWGLPDGPAQLAGAVRFELAPDGDGCVLTLTNPGTGSARIWTSVRRDGTPIWKRSTAPRRGFAPLEQRARAAPSRNATRPRWRRSDSPTFAAADPLR